MKSALRSILSAAVAAIRRHGWFPLAVFLAHELSAHVIDGYRRWPSIDLPLHFFGGLAIACFASGALRVFEKRGLVRPPDAILRVALLFGLVHAAALLWEFAEWIADRFLGTTCQLSLDDTLLDLFMGVLGGLVFLLPQFPEALRAFFNPAPSLESRP